MLVPGEQPGHDERAGEIESLELGDVGCGERKGGRRTDDQVEQLVQQRHDHAHDEQHEKDCTPDRPQPPIVTKNERRRCSSCHRPIPLSDSSAASAFMRRTARAGATLNRLVDNRLDATFSALADPTRRGMLASLALGEKSIGELAEPFAMTFAGASKHVKVLEEAGLVARRKDGRTHLISIEAKPLEEAERWLRQWEKFWTVRLDRLEAAMERDKHKENDNG